MVKVHEEAFESVSHCFVQTAFEPSQYFWLHQRQAFSDVFLLDVNHRRENRK